MLSQLLLLILDYLRKNKRLTISIEENILKTVTVTSAGLSSIVSPNDTTTYTLNYVVDDKGCESNLNDEATLFVNTLSAPTGVRCLIYLQIFISFQKRRKYD